MLNVAHPFQRALGSFRGLTGISRAFRETPYEVHFSGPHEISEGIWGVSKNLSGILGILGSVSEGLQEVLGVSGGPQRSQRVSEELRVFQRYSRPLQARFRVY